MSQFSFLNQNLINRTAVITFNKFSVVVHLLGTKWFFFSLAK